MTVTHLLSGAVGLLLGIALVIVLTMTAGSPAKGRRLEASDPTFPQISGQNLNGRTIDLPSALDAAWNVLIVAFYQRQQIDVDTWLPVARELATNHANVEYYELPTISSGWSLARWWVDGGMRSGIPEFAARERTITLYTDTERFRRAAGIDGAERIWIGLVDRHGRVCWSTRGPATQAQIESLREAVMRLASPEAERFA